MLCLCLHNVDVSEHSLDADNPGEKEQISSRKRATTAIKAR